MIRGCPDPVQDRKPSMTSARRAYATDLTDAEWQLLAPLIPAPKPGGRPPLHDRRELVNAMAYWLRAGCAWRLLPHDLPPWQTVYHYFRSWRDQGLWEQIHHVLHVQERIRQGRAPTPSAAILDSQSVKTTERGAARLRRRQEGQRPQAPPAGRHPRPDHQGPPDRGRRRRPRRGRRAAQAPRPATARLGRRRLPRPVPGLGTAAPRHQLPGRVAQRWWPPAPLAAARRDSTDRVPVRRGATPVGGGADLRLAGAIPPPQQGLRISHRHLRGRHLSGHDPAAAAPPHPPMSLFRHPLGCVQEWRGIRPGRGTMADSEQMVSTVLDRLVRSSRARFDADEPLLGWAVRFGFSILGEDVRRELVVSAIGQPWRLAGGRGMAAAGGQEFAAFDQPGYAKMAANFRLDPIAGGRATRLSTETRVACTDPSSARRFGRYWRLIRPASGATRRSWLTAIKRRAERAAGEADPAVPAR